MAIFAYPSWTAAPLLSLYPAAAAPSAPPAAPPAAPLRIILLPPAAVLRCSEWCE
jgi:hypothetical protein